jgi:hypothetical protein
MRATCPSHLSSVTYHCNYTWRRAQITKRLLMQSSPTSYHLIPLRSKYSHHPVLILSLCSFLNTRTRDKVAHPYKTTSKILVLYILIFTLFDSKGEQKFLDWLVASTTPR